MTIGKPVMFVLALILSVSLGMITGCGDKEESITDPGNGDGDGNGHVDEVYVELTWEPGHVHILSDVVYTVKFTDDHGTLTDFDSVSVERQAEGSDTWRGTMLELNGDVFEGTYMYSSSGEYSLRVMGKGEHDTEIELMYEMPDSLNLHAVPAHGSGGGYRVEFETFPGHIHTGAEITLKYWIMETERDSTTNERAPITGLSCEIHVNEAGASEGDYSATESEPGVYEATHTFTDVGDAHAAIHFTGIDGTSAEVEYELHVVSGH